MIVGAGPAGLSAARGYREAGGEAEVVLLGAEPHHPYERPPLTKDYLRGEHGPRRAVHGARPPLPRAGDRPRASGAPSAALDPGSRTAVADRGRRELRFGRLRPGHRVGAAAPAGAGGRRRAPAHDPRDGGLRAPAVAGRERSAADGGGLGLHRLRGRGLAGHARLPRDAGERRRRRPTPRGWATRWGRSSPSGSTRPA